MSRLGITRAQGSISVPGTVVVTVIGMLLVALVVTVTLVF
jgi:hypothetical protein